MKKVILWVIIVLLAAYSVIATVGMIETRSELEQKTADYEKMKENYFKEKEKNIKLEFEKAIK